MGTGEMCKTEEGVNCAVPSKSLAGLPWCGEEPTSELPVTSTTSLPAESGCVDSSTWYFGGKKSKNCKWVGNDPAKRCKKSASIEGVTVSAGDACCRACGPPPTEEPIADGCVDSSTWYFGG